MSLAGVRRSSLRRIGLSAFDIGVWSFSLFAATVLRYELDLQQIADANLELITFLAVAGAPLVGAAFQAYRGRNSIGTVEDAINVSTATGVVGGVLFGANILSSSALVPRSVPLIATLIALLIAVGARVAVRLYRERIARPDRHLSQRVIIFGAGVDGRQLVRSMLSDQDSGYLPVALLDDAPDLRNRRVSGVSVRGTHSDLAAIAAATRADLLVVARREAGAGIVRTLARAATESGLGVKVLPPLAELLRPWVGHSDLRDLDITDLLGRRPVDIDLAGAGDGRGWIDRLRAVPADPPLRARRAADARP
jgi:FlaA1/EpsC-like NDP-sugar epimerase